MSQKKTQEPALVSLSRAEHAELLGRLKSGQLEAKDRELLISIVNAVVWLSSALEHKKLSMKKILRLFGFRREKLADVFPKPEPSKSVNDDNNKTASADEANVAATPGGGNPKNETDTKTGGGKSTTSDSSGPKGHGRLGAEAYRIADADIKFYAHETLTKGSACPSCLTGTLYELEPGSLVKIYGQPPFKAVNHQQERLRCASCGEVFKAALPKDIPRGKYDAQAKSLLAVFRFQMGIPHHRLAKLQKALGVPMPPSTQWQEMEAAAAPARVIFKELNKVAADGRLFKSDDTSMCILELKKSLKENADARTGIYTSAILSKLDDGKKIALFFSSNRHAGENLSRVLKERDLNELTALHMCDASSTNTKTNFDMIVLHCLDHARRQFVDLATSFPGESQHVLTELGKIYHNDKISRTLGMNKWDRLAFHIQHSKPVMEHLEVWLEQKLAAMDTEENSGLGDAIKYMLKRWSSFCGFFRYAGAPLSNAECERQIKTAIFHRKNSLFYKTEFGALIGDIFMSLIQTCVNASVNPVEYLTALQKYSKQVFASPAAWLPWSYHEAMARVQ